MENWGKYSIENWAQMQPKLVVNPRMEKGERTALAIGRNQRFPIAPIAAN